MITLESPALFPPRDAHTEVPRVLVVDDDEHILKLEVEILNRAGLAVVTAKDGNAAWKALLAGGFDMLVTDYRMPGVSGVALIRQARIAKLDLPVVMVSASFAELDTERLSHDPWTRVAAFVHKPFTVAGLTSAVVGALTPQSASTWIQRLSSA
jgi:CheY-like chemotaxis protein